MTCSICGGDGEEECGYCDGNGRVECGECDGKGEIETNEKVYEIKQNVWTTINLTQIFENPLKRLNNYLYFYFWFLYKYYLNLYF